MKKITNCVRGVTSPTLANLVLDGIEDLLGRKFNALNRYGRRRQNSPEGIHFVRYADDFVVIAKSKDTLEKEVYPMIEMYLKERGLELSPDKTKVTHISEGFDFLGQNIRKYRFGKQSAKLLIKPSIKNVKSFLTGIRQTIKVMATASQESLIRILNPKIRGWANYHRSVVSKEIFSRVDYEIWKAIWRWAVRRHPNKNKSWIHAKYFRKIKERNHCFSCEVNDELSKESSILKLCFASDTIIRRHMQIRSEANPFDPAYDLYFEKRITSKMSGNKEGRSTIEALWRRQKRCCTKCSERITAETGWHVKYLESRVEGGSGKLNNLTLIHVGCINVKTIIGLFLCVAGWEA